jgi:hypothetical protein
LYYEPKKGTKEFIPWFLFSFLSYGGEPLAVCSANSKVCGSSNYILALTPSANGGSEPSTHLHQLQPILNRLLEASAASLTRDFRFLEEKL